MDKASEDRIDYHLSLLDSRIKTKPSIDCEVVPVWDEGGQKRTLHAGQLKGWESVKRFVVLLAGARGGKALPLDTPIATPDGFVPMGEIRLGDEVCCPDGSVAIVTAVSPVMHDHQCYRVSFDDGSSIIADEGHLWETQSYHDRRGDSKHLGSRRKVRTTRQILETLRYRGRLNHSIPMPSPAAMDTRDLPIDPYVLGVWLGDGNSDSASVTCADRGIIEEIESLGLKVGSGRECNSGKALAYTLGMSALPPGGNTRRSDSLHTKLRLLGLIKNKHIPVEYLESAPHQRLALLQGLMDTDGYCAMDGQSEFCNKNPRIANGVVELCRSLGIKVRIRWRNVNGGRYARVLFTTSLPVFRLERKKSRQKADTSPTTKRRYFTSIEPVESVPVKCIAVSHPSRLYIAGRDYIPTHNTAVGARMLLREIQRTAVPGERNHYLIVGPTLELLKRAALPQFDELVHGLADYKGNDHIYVFSREGAKRLCGFPGDIRVYVGYATKPGSLEAATFKGVWADEAGQPEFLADSWEAIQRRTALHESRVFITTTPYTITGWLREFCRQIIEGERSDAELIRFRSIDNPMFSQDEYDRMRREWPDWKFKMFCEGEFAKPSGAIYDCFDDECIVPDFEIPDSWPRHIGVDFGQVNTACVFVAEDPQGVLYVYGDYLTGGRSAAEHAAAMSRKGLGSFRPLDSEWEQTFGVCIGGSWSEDDWRTDYITAGLPLVRPPIKDVEVGITRVYRQLKNRTLRVFKSCSRTIDQLNGYSRKVDERGEPTEDIADKAKWHLCDSVRYIVGTLRPSGEVDSWIKSRISEPEKREPVIEDLSKYRRNTKFIEEDEPEEKGLGQVSVK